MKTQQYFSGAIFNTSHQNEVLRFRLFLHSGASKLLHMGLACWRLKTCAYGTLIVPINCAVRLLTFFETIFHILY